MKQGASRHALRARKDDLYETPEVDRRASAAASGRIGRQGDSRSREHGQFRANADRAAAVAAYLAPKPGESLGRWPANVLHDGSDEVVAAFPSTSASSARPRNNGEFKSVAKGRDAPHVTQGHEDDGGSAARFFYSAKADSVDRIGSKHPTVKPLDLMRWLVRLVTPPGGVVLDLFAGSGTTGEAALLEGFNAVLIEREADHCVDIERRIAHVFDGPVGRSVARTKAKAPKAAAAPLFGEE